MKFSFLALALLALTLQGCGTVQKEAPTKASSNTADLFESSQNDLKKGRQNDATKKLKQLIATEPNSELADDAAIELGNLYFSEQAYEQAYDQYMKVVQSKVYSPKETDALYLAAKCLFFLDRLDAASGLLEKSLKLEPKKPERMAQIHELLFRVRRQQGDVIDALRSLAFLIENHPDEATRLQHRSEGIKVLQGGLANEELEYVAGRSEFGVLRGYAMAFLAEKHLILREFDEAARYYTGVIEYLPNTEWADQGQKFLHRLEAQRKVDAKTIGVVLPLSGKHSQFAYKTLKGIQLALGIFGEPNSPYKLAVVDSEGNTDVAQRAVERLVLEDHVIAIIGSLLSKTSEAVSKTAHEFGVPSIALSQKSGITAVGDSVFRNALTAEMQVKHLVNYAMDEMGMRKFAILFPNDFYGVEYANLFWDYVLAKNGQITAVQPYRPKETDFKGPVRRMVGTFYIEGRLDEYKHYLTEWQKQNLRVSLRREMPDDLLPPIVDFDAIFIPDGTKALGQIAPMLRFNDVSKVHLLGTNLWNSTSVISRGQSMGGNLLFVDAEVSTDQSLQRTYFYQQFQQTFGTAPGHFEVQAYDSARLLRDLIEQGATSRKDLITRLQSMKSYAGVSGELSLNSSREIEPPLVTFTVKNGNIKRVNDLEKR